MVAPVQKHELCVEVFVTTVGFTQDTQRPNGSRLNRKLYGNSSYEWYAYFCENNFIHTITLISFPIKFSFLYSVNRWVDPGFLRWDGMGWEQTTTTLFLANCSHKLQETVSKV